MIGANRSLGRLARSLAIVAVAGATLSGCDKAEKTVEKAANTVGVVTDPSVPSPVAEMVEPHGEMVWLDLPFANSCSDSVETFPNVGLYYKKEGKPWPEMQEANMPITWEHPLPTPIEENVKRTFVNSAMRNLITLGHIQLASNVNGLGASFYCPQISAPPLGADFNSYSTANGTVNRGLIRVGTLEFDHADHISTFQKTRLEGYTAEHRKFKIFAKLAENPKYGKTQILLERDLVVFLNPEDRLWQIDPNDHTDWFKAP